LLPFLYSWPFTSLFNGPNSMFYHSQDSVLKRFHDAGFIPKNNRHHNRSNSSPKFWFTSIIFCIDCTWGQIKIVTSLARLCRASTFSTAEVSLLHKITVPTLVRRPPPGRRADSYSYGRRKNDQHAFYDRPEKNPCRSALNRHTSRKPPGCCTAGRLCTMHQFVAGGAANRPGGLTVDVNLTERFGPFHGSKTRRVQCTRSAHYQREVTVTTAQQGRCTPGLALDLERAALLVSYSSGGCNAPPGLSLNTLIYTRSNLLASVSHMLQLSVCLCVCHKNMGSAMVRLGTLTAVEHLVASPTTAI